ncbi:MAG: response regulator transcription factor [Actinomycetota bacterium]|nr:response regulator transcription factor [Actinomycetota bacterium]
MAVIRVLIVDDHPVVRRGLIALLSSLAGVEVVGEAGDGEQAVREAQILAPDVVLMDIQMPRMDGIQATRRIIAAAPGTAVLVLSMFETDESVVTVLEAGARGYLLKGAGQDEIARALQAVAAGQVVLEPSVAARLVRRGTGPEPAPVPLPMLTIRERQVLDGLAAGRSNTAVAGALGLSVKTVSNHVSSVFAKLGVATRAEAVVVGREHGLGKSGAP